MLYPLNVAVHRDALWANCLQLFLSPLVIVATDSWPFLGRKKTQSLFVISGDRTVSGNRFFSLQRACSACKHLLQLTKRCCSEGVRLLHFLVQVMHLWGGLAAVYLA